MLDPEQVQALAIIMVGAFLMVLAIAVFYVFAFRPRLKESEPLMALGMLDDDLREELLAQRTAVEQLNTALTHHAHSLENITASDGAVDRLHERLTSQAEMVNALIEQLQQHSAHITGLDDNEQNLADLIQAQTDQMASIIYRLDATVGSRGQPVLAQEDNAFNNKLDDYARALADLDRELAAQSFIIQGLDGRVNDQTGLFVTAAEERHHQTTLIERVWDQVAQMMPLLNKLVSAPLHAGQVRLTDIQGIGPVYAGRLHEAGIHTFEQLATLTPDEIYMLINEPEWREKSIDAANWIEQAQHLASQRKKVESIP